MLKTLAILAPDPKPETVKSMFTLYSYHRRKKELEFRKWKKIPMVDAGIHAIQELMHKHPEALLYGQDVGGRIGAFSEKR